MLSATSNKKTIFSTICYTHIIWCIKYLNSVLKMQKYQEKPIPLVFRGEDSKYSINADAIELLRSIEGKLAVISVAGIYRTGKSFLLNKMLLNSESGFAVGPTTNPKTKGIWIWGKPLIYKNNDEIINVLVLDSEGLGSTQEDINHDLRLFSVTLLLSSAFMYNTLGAIDENAIDSLGLVLRLCQHLKDDKFNDFPDFYWILRDFSLALVDKDNSPLSTKKYLENCLSSQPGDSEIRNKIRVSIRQAFHNRNCYTFVRPSTDETCLQNLDQKDMESLRPQFVEQVIEFRKQIFNNLKTKSIKGHEVTGNMMCELLKIYIDSINDQKLPEIENGWEHLCLKELHEVLDGIEEAVANKVQELKNHVPRSQKQLMTEQEKIMDEFEELFQRKLSSNHRAQEQFGSVKQLVQKSMKVIESEMKVKNAKETQNFIRNEFKSIEKRVKDSEFRTMGQLVKQFEIFYEYYRKKCPYKDDIQTGLEVIMKKFSESSMIMYSHLEKRKNTQIGNLKEEIQAVKTEFTQKDQKAKQDRARLQGDIAKLQMTIEELNKQNSMLSLTVAEAETKITQLEALNNKNLEQQLENENLKLKKQILELENSQRESICRHNQEKSELSQRILLQQNKIDNLERYKTELTVKLDEIQGIYEKNKSEENQRNSDLMQKLNELNQEKKIVENNFRQQIDDKEHELKKLESMYETRCGDITQAADSKTKKEREQLETLLKQAHCTINQLEATIEKLSVENKKLVESLSLKNRSLEKDLLERQATLKKITLKFEQEKALLSQKIEFIQHECDQKTQKNKTLSQQNTNYSALFEEKQQQIQELAAELEEVKSYEQAEGEQIERKIGQMAEDLDRKHQRIREIQADKKQLQTQVESKNNELTLKLEQIRILKQKFEQVSKQKQKQLQELQFNHHNTLKQSQQQLQALKSENQRYNEQQKRNAELSLVQLKNYYEMEKQRLEKRLLQERKKYQFTEANTIIEIEGKYKRINSQQSHEIEQLKSINEELENQVTKIEAEYCTRMQNLEQQLVSEKKCMDNKYEILRRKFDDLSDELEFIERNNEDERISFIKKIEGLNFELSRKEKEIMQMNVKKESLENGLTKKDGQLESLRKTMHQEIESSLKKVSEVQAKYQKINEEYMEFKIEAEKENALCKQRNEFLTARLNQLSKEKESGSMKNLEKMDRTKISELKEQVEKLKSENMSMESKGEHLRKNAKQTANSHKRELSQIEKEKQLLAQKLQILETKNKQLMARVEQKNQVFTKDLEQKRVKHESERSKMQSEIDAQKEKINELQEQRNQAEWEKQKQITLVTQRLKYVEYQRDENKKELEQTEKRLNLALAQLKKNNDKGLQDSGIRRQSVDKRYSNQLQLVKMSSKARQDELEEHCKKLKQENKCLKEKNMDYYQKVSQLEKIAAQDRNLGQQIERLNRKQEQLNALHKKEQENQNEDFKRKIVQLQKKNRELQCNNNQFIFVLEKEKTKTNMQRQALQDKIKKLQQENRSLQHKIQGRKFKNQSESKFSMTASDSFGWRA